MNERWKRREWTKEEKKDNPSVEVHGENSPRGVGREFAVCVTWQFVFITVSGWKSHQIKNSARQRTTFKSEVWLECSNFCIVDRCKFLFGPISYLKATKITIMALIWIRIQHVSFWKHFLTLCWPNGKKKCVCVRACVYLKLHWAPGCWVGSWPLWPLCRLKCSQHPSSSPTPAGAPPASDLQLLQHKSINRTSSHTHKDTHGISTEDSFMCSFVIMQVWIGLLSLLSAA